MEHLIVTLKPTDIIYVADMGFVISQKAIEDGDFLLDRRDGITASCMFVYINGKLAIKKGNHTEYDVSATSVYKLTPFSPELN